MIKASQSYKFNQKILNWIKSLTTESYLFFLIVIFYLLLWWINPGNYLILASYFILFFLINYKLKNAKLSLLVTFLTSSIVFTGKMFPIQLVPPGIYDPKIYPDGYLVNAVVAPSNIISVIMLIVIIREIVINKAKPNFVNTANILLFAYFMWGIVSSVFGSKRPEVSVVFDTLGLSSLIFYFYLQLKTTTTKIFIKLLMAIFSAFVVVESLFALNQFILKSPADKNLEFSRSFQETGQTTDEQKFIYRPGGTFDHANTLAMHLTFWMLCILGVYLATREGLYLFLLGLGSGVLIITLSRSAWMGFAAGILFILYIVEKVKKIKIKFDFGKYTSLILITGSLLTYFFILPRILTSTYTFSEGGGQLRIQQIKESWQIVEQYPIFGVGASMLVVEGLTLFPKSVFGKDALDVHNWYFSKMTSNGIPVILLFLLFVSVSLKPIFKNILNSNKPNYYDFILISFAASTLCFFVIGAFSANNGIFYLILFYGLLNNQETLYEQNKRKT